jgi:hypothetical protein
VLWRYGEKSVIYSPHPHPHPRFQVTTVSLELLENKNIFFYFEKHHSLLEKKIFEIGWGLGVYQLPKTIFFLPKTTLFDFQMYGFYLWMVL